MTLPLLHTKHLNTPRLVADDTQTTVWKWEQQEPFGVNAANDDPDGNAVAFEFNLRFPGQYLDKETGLHYNYFRDYDAGIGRYVESDPIGLAAALNTYAYVEGSPLVHVDFDGLRSFRCTKPLDTLTEKFGAGAAQFAHKYGPYTYHQYSCVVEQNGKITCGGQDHSGRAVWSPGKPTNDVFRQESCEQSQPDNKCFEDCLKEEWRKPRPQYGIPFGKDCQNYDDDVNKTCRMKCNIK